MYTIGHLVKNFALSRSTLLYYDKIGLLTPSGRSEANYRMYTEQDVKKMQLIELYKDAGLSLNDIARLLQHDTANASRDILEQRLLQLNHDINALRAQQQVLVGLLGETSNLVQSKVMTKEQWTAILRASGMNDQDMRNWHIEFEMSMPQAHEDFLQSLGIDELERATIRAWKRD